MRQTSGETHYSQNFQSSSMDEQRKTVSQIKTNIFIVQKFRFNSYIYKLITSVIEMKLIKIDNFYTYIFIQNVIYNYNYNMYIMIYNMYIYLIYIL